MGFLTNLESQAFNLQANTGQAFGQMLGGALNPILGTTVTSSTSTTTKPQAKQSNTMPIIIISAVVLVIAVAGFIYFKKAKS